MPHLIHCPASCGPAASRSPSGLSGRLLTVRLAPARARQRCHQRVPQRRMLPADATYYYLRHSIKHACVRPPQQPHCESSPYACLTIFPPRYSSAAPPCSPVAHTLARSYALAPAHPVAHTLSAHSSHPSIHCELASIGGEGLPRDVPPACDAGCVQACAQSACHAAHGALCKQHASTPALRVVAGSEACDARHWVQQCFTWQACPCSRRACMQVGSAHHAGVPVPVDKACARARACLA